MGIEALLVGQNFTNYRGQTVEFSGNVRNHILERHPEMYAYIDEVWNVLANPDLVYSHVRTKTHWYYKLGICKEREAGTYMLVIVGYNDEGYRWVKTCHSILNPVVERGHQRIFQGQMS